MKKPFAAVWRRRAFRIMTISFMLLSDLTFVHGEKVKSGFQKFELVFFAFAEIIQGVKNAVPVPELLAEAQIGQQQFGAGRGYRVHEHCRNPYHVEHIPQYLHTQFIVIL